MGTDMIKMSVNDVNKINLQTFLSHMGVVLRNICFEINLNYDIVVKKLISGKKTISNETQSFSKIADEF